jgi:hypothetical protein
MLTLVSRVQGVFVWRIRRFSNSVWVDELQRVESELPQVPSTAAALNLARSILPTELQYLIRHLESDEEGDFDSLGDEAFGEDVGHCVEAGEGRLGSAWASELCIAEISDWIGPRVRTTINSCAQLDDG